MVSMMGACWIEVSQSGTNPSVLTLVLPASPLFPSFRNVDKSCAPPPRHGSVPCCVLCATLCCACTTSDTEGLQKYFSQFGKVSQCQIMRDPNSGKSRGFAFLTFEDPKSVNTVMVREHFLDGKIVSRYRLLSC